MSHKNQLLFTGVDLYNTPLLKEDSLLLLPEPVQTYLRFSNCLEKPEIKTVRLKQKGLFNINGKKWTRMTAEQYFNIETCSFIWKAKTSLFRVVDEYVGNKGRLKIKLLGLFKMGEITGKEMDQGEVLRFLTESIWFPTFLASDKVTWKKVDDLSADATMSYENGEVVARFYFKSSGELTKITAKRYREVKGQFELNDWEISNFEYKTFHGISIPYKTHVSWKLPGEDLCYYQLEITDIAYNVSEGY